VNELLGHFVRFAYVTKGLLYGLIGWLAIRAALGQGGKATNPDGALKEIPKEVPFGSELLIPVAIGLAIYGVWRLAESVLDPEGRLQHPTKMIVRVGYFISGLSYGLLAYLAATLAFGWAHHGHTKHDLIGKMVDTSWGPTLVVIIGLVFIAVGIHQLWESIGGAFMKRYNRARMSKKMCTIARVLGSFGLAARSVTFFIIGGFTVKAAFAAKPGEIKDLGQALRLISEAGDAPWLFAIVATGFIAYGFYCLTNAWYRRLSITPA
jgi:hypothetical protein